MRFTIAVVVSFGLAILSLSQAQSAGFALATEGKLFLSACAETKVTDAPPGTGPDRIRPTKDGVESPFLDIPFALHVPFEVRHEGGPVRVMWRVTVKWEDAPAEWGESPYLMSSHLGLYRADGRQITPGSVQRGKSALTWEPNAPLPTCTSILQHLDGSMGVFDYRISSERDAHKPSMADAGSLLLNPAEPGTHALWLAMRTYNFWLKEPKREVVRGTFYADVLVARGEATPSEKEVAYLFGQGPRPAEMAEDKFYWAATMELPFKLRRNGWEFDHVEMIPRAQHVERLVTKKYVARNDYIFLYDGTSPVVKANTVDIHFVETVLTDPHPNGGGSRDDASGYRTVHADEFNWFISLPPKIPDHGFAIITASGERLSGFRQKPGWEPPKPIASYRWDIAPTVLPPEVKKSHEPRSSYVSMMFEPTSDRYGNAPDSPGFAKQRAEFLEKHGNDAAEWFLPSRYSDLTGMRPKKGDPAFNYVLFAGERPDVRDVGAFPLVAREVGPWILVGFYKRLNEVEGRVGGSSVTPGERTIVSDADDYWAWFAEFSMVLAREKPEADKAVAKAALETEPLQNLLATQSKLKAALGGEGLPPAGIMEQIGGWLDNTILKLNIGTIPLVNSEPGSVNTPVAVAQAQQTRTLNKMGETTEAIRKCRERIKDCSDDARAAYQVIMDKLQQGNEKYGGPAHGELYVYRQKYRKIFERIAFDIALASKDPYLLKQALDEAALEARSEQSRVLEAQYQMSLGNPVAALFALRSAVRVDPKSTMAAQMLQNLECVFLKVAIEKSEGAIKEARAAFYGYLMERGFSDHALRTAGNWPFARAMAWTEYSLDKYSEVPWAIFTTGLYGSMSAFTGKLEAQETLLATNENRLVTAYIGLQSILRLRGKGYTFDQIKAMRSSDILTALPLKKLNGDYYSDQEAAWHRTGIQIAMTELPDVQALIEPLPPSWVDGQSLQPGEQLGLELGLQKQYWRSQDVGDTWLEWMGDATSMYNLFLMLPSAKAGTSGRGMAVLWGESELETIRALEKSGQVITGTEFVANTVGLTQFLGAAGATETGQTILGYLKSIGRYEDKLAWYNKVIWTTGKLTGMLAINFTTTISTEKLFGHKAAMLMQAALMFGSDPDTLIKLLDAQNIPRQQVAELITKHYLPATQVHIKRLEQIKTRSLLLDQLFEQVKKGQKITAQDELFLEKYFAKDWRQLIPNGQASHDASIAAAAAAEGASNGVNNGASGAVAALTPALEAEAASVLSASEEARRLAEVLTNTPRLPRALPPPLEPPSIPRHLPRERFETRRGPTPTYTTNKNYPQPPVAQEMSESAVAEALLMSRKYDQAQAKFDQIIERVRKGELTEADELPIEWLHKKRCLAYELQTATRKLPRGPSGLTTALNQAEVEEVLNNPQLWERPAGIEQGAYSLVHDVKGKDHLLVKEVPDKLPVFNKDGTPQIDPATNLQVMKPIAVLQDVQNTMIHNELARALGFEVPAMEVKLFYNAKGEVTKAVYVMRKVKGRLLSELSAAEIFLYKEELSRHRALAVLINDYDRHIKNYIVTEEGHLVPIDAGVADVMGSRSLAEGVADPVIMEGAWGRDHWFSRFFKNEICGDLKELEPEIDLFSPGETFHRKGLVAEESLSYRAALPTIQDIEKMVTDEEKFRKLISDTYEHHFNNEQVIQSRVDSVKAAKEAGGHKVDLKEIREGVLMELAVELKEMVDATVSAATIRNQRLNAVMKGLDQRHVIPRRVNQASVPVPQVTRQRRMTAFRWVEPQYRMAA